MSVQTLQAAVDGIVVSAITILTSHVYAPEDSREATKGKERLLLMAHVGGLLCGKVVIILLTDSLQIVLLEGVLGRGNEQGQLHVGLIDLEVRAALEDDHGHTAKVGFLLFVS